MDIFIFSGWAEYGYIYILGVGRIWIYIYSWGGRDIDIFIFFRKQDSTDDKD